ncbi:MAG: hypothetical protein VZR56_06280 [Treponema sp.]|nr:hypothetical protein [Treponema sp.]MEE3313744.1 hypothetical protein [Treponema sp.]
MIVEGIFDGSAVRPLEPLALELNQRVFIEIPKTKFSSTEQRKINEKIAALDDIFGMLTPEEEKTYDSVISNKMSFKERVTP